MVYRVSQFGHFCGVSPLSVKIEHCGFRDSVLLFYEINNGASRIVIALPVVEIQGGIEKYHFSGTLRVSVIFELIEEVNDIYKGCGYNRYYKIYNEIKIEKTDLSDYKNGVVHIFAKDIIL